MQGNIAEIGIALQAAKGTAASAMQHRMRLSGGGFGEQKDIEDIVESTGDVLLESAFVARIRAEGSPAFIGRPNFISLLAYAALGAKAVSGAADPYTHTNTLVATPFALPWLTVWAMLADGKRVRVTDCKVAVLRFESSAAGLLVVTATIVGRTPVYRTSAGWTTDQAAIAVETANPFIHGDAAGGLKVEGVAVTRIEKAMVEINNGAVAQYGDSIAPDDISQARRTIMVETTEIIADFALYNRLFYGTAAPTSGDAPTTNVLELAGSPAGIDFKYIRQPTPERSLEILVPRLQVVSLGGLEYNGNGDPIKQTAQYRGFRPSSGSGMSVIVKNAVASYPAL